MEDLWVVDEQTRQVARSDVVCESGSRVVERLAGLEARLQKEEIPANLAMLERERNSIGKAIRAAWGVIDRLDR